MNYTIKYLKGENNSALVYIPCESETAEAVFAALPVPRPSVAAICGVSWNCDMSPFPSPPVFRGGDSFSGGADEFLRKLRPLIEDFENTLPEKPTKRIIAGYSLGGLFALYSLYKTDLFSACACVSGSLWFPGFAEFAQNEKMPSHPDMVYISVGEREHKTKNRVLSTVRDCTEKICETLRSQNIKVCFETNPGGHFAPSAPRMSAGIKKLL